MKKLILTLVCVISIVSFTNAQANRTIGLRGGGWLGEISYQHPLSDSQRLELGVSFPWALNSIHLSGAYQFVNDLSALADGFNWYYGVGARVGLGQGFHLGAFGNLGIEYDFQDLISFPLVLSLDWRPGIGTGFYNQDDGGGLIPPYFDWNGFGLGIRFKF